MVEFQSTNHGWQPLLQPMAELIAEGTAKGMLKGTCKATSEKFQLVVRSAEAKSVGDLLITAPTSGLTCWTMVCQ